MNPNTNPKTTEYRPRVKRYEARTTEELQVLNKDGVHGNCDERCQADNLSLHEVEGAPVNENNRCRACADDELTFLSSKLNAWTWRHWLPWERTVESSEYNKNGHVVYSLHELGIEVRHNDDERLMVNLIGRRADHFWLPHDWRLRQALKSHFDRRKTAAQILDRLEPHFRREMLDSGEYYDLEIEDTEFTVAGDYDDANPPHALDAKRVLNGNIVHVKDGDSGCSPAIFVKAVDGKTYELLSDEDLNLFVRPCEDSVKTHFFLESDARFQPKAVDDDSA